MMTFNFAVCDDDDVALSAISGALMNVFQKNGVSVTCDAYLSSADLYELLPEKRYNAVFLDIDMPGMDGITLGKKLKEAEEPVDIIYVSSREDRVFESFSVHPYGFIRKSNFLRDIADMARLYIAEHSGGGVGQLIELQLHNSIVSVKADDIIYIESLKDYQYIYMRNKKEPDKIRLSMEVLETQLDPHGFIRVHKGFLVNYKYIRRIDNADIMLTIGTTLPVSRRKLNETRQKYMQLSRSQGTFRLG